MEDGSIKRGVAAVTGGTGFVGRRVVGALLGAGWTVRALVRDKQRSGKALPEHPSLSTVEGDILDAGALDRLMDGAAACVHLVGIIREGGGDQTFEKMHAEATRRVVEAGERASQRAGTGGADGARTPIRHLQMSALGVRDGATVPYQRTKREGERAVEGSALRWTIFRPSMIHGPGGEFTEMAAGWVRGRKAPFVFVPYFVPGWLPAGHGALVAPVHVDDVAGAFRAALEGERAVGRTYDLAGPEALRFDDMLGVFKAEVAGAKRLPLIGVPVEPAALAARCFKGVGLGRLPPFDEGMARMAAQDSVSACAPARTDLGFDPRPFSASLSAYAGEL